MYIYIYFFQNVSTHVFFFKMSCHLVLFIPHLFFSISYSDIYNKIVIKIMR